jgi:meso-butanediol dehydrogenase / (S,S)-butanediol dehydrogenase / diacetyl reductase
MQEAEKRMSELNGVTCLITGAGGGIGSAIARRLAADGANVVLADLDPGPAQEVVAELGAGASAIAADVTDEEQMRAAVDHTVDAHGSLDVIFNNAGIALFTPLPAIGRRQFDQLMSVNVFGVLVGSKVAAAQMAVQEGGGKIVNTCSVAGKRGAPNSSLYVATKFAVRGITQSLAQELAGDGITVNAFCPGIVDTPLWGPLGEEFAASGAVERPGEVTAMLAADVVLGRVSTAQDLTGIAAFLASPDSDYMTGQCVNVDGGMAFD